MDHKWNVSVYTRISLNYVSDSIHLDFVTSEFFYHLPVCCSDNYQVSLLDARPRYAIIFIRRIP